MDEQRDVIIIGGGLVGCTLALALNAHGLSSTVIERAPMAALQAPGHDGRVSAIASASANMLRTLGLGDLLDAGCPIDEIRVTDGHSPLHLHFDGRDEGKPLGIMVENSRLRAELARAASDGANVALRAPATVTGIEREPQGASVLLDDGTRVAAPLVVAADGRNSALRKDAGIRVAQWRYQNASIIATLAHEEPHGNIAFELFFPAGPFALLPMPDLADDAAHDSGGARLVHRSAMVWTVAAKDAPAYLDLPERAFLAEVTKRMDGFLGRVGLLSRPMSYPLGFHHAERYVGTRLALIGDAAHAIHPIAGQGLNLGLRDVAALAETLVDASRIGLDLGSGEVLARYERWRRLDNSVIAAATDSLTRLFGIEGRLPAMARRAGLATVNHVAPLKRMFMAGARGELGDLPKLLTGQLA